MKNRMQSKHISGFTMVETLAVVAIIIILLGVSAVPAAKYVDTLKIMELDNAARDIYMAAQNRAELLSGAGSGNLTKLVETGASGKTTTLTTRGHTDDAGKEKLYYLSQDDVADLLPTGSIDQTLWDGYFYIVYDVISGSVTDVFYAKDPMPDLAGTDFKEFYEGTSRKAADTRDKRIANKEEWGLIGWYNGDAAKGKNSDTQRPDTDGKPYIDVTIYNEEELTVKLTVKWDKSIDTEVRGAINGSNTNLTVGLGPNSSSTPLDLFTTYKDGNPRKKVDTPLTSGTYEYSCTWRLDSLNKGTAGESLQFKDLAGSNVTPGDDFTVKATLTVGGEAFTDDDTDNSLFWQDEEGAINSSGNTAYIKYLRHLQNLSANADGYDNGSMFDSGVRTNKKNAKQVADIRVYTNETYEEYNFIPIVNTNLAGYDGDDKIINELHIEHTGAKNQGLFGINYGAVENVAVKGGDNGSVTGGENVGGIAGTNYGTVENCAWSGALKGNKSVGGYVGTNSGTVDNCNRDAVNNIDITVTGDNPQNIGGIVGLHDARGSDTGIKECNNELEVDAAGAKNVGGIVGRFTASGDNNKATMENCDNGIEDKAGAVDAVTVKGASNVGGLAGETEGGENAQILKCNNYATVFGTVRFVGGLVGYNGGFLGYDGEDHVEDGKLVNPNACKNDGHVIGGSGTIEKDAEDDKIINFDKITSSASDVGGIAGFSEGTVDGGEIGVGEISVIGRDNVGGFVGSSTGTVQNCTRPGRRNGADGGTRISISASGSTVGGIVGLNGAKDGDNTKAIVINCINKADLEYANCSSVGGIVGENYGFVGTRSSADGDETTVCYNTGNVTGKTNVGGLVGVNREGGVVDGCNDKRNKGNITGEVDKKDNKGGDQVGGFVGGMSGGTVKNCVRAGETGQISGQQYIGGIVGRAYGGTIKGCVNERPVSATKVDSYVGGIVGGVENSGMVEKCRNTMVKGVDFTGINYVGGIAGSVKGESTVVDKCYNGDSTLANDAKKAGGEFGAIKGEWYVGGIAGYIKGSKISNSYNKANVEAVYCAGGIVGASEGGQIWTSYSAGNVTGVDYVGGILGLSKGTTETEMQVVYVDGSTGDKIGYDFNKATSTWSYTKVYQPLVSVTEGSSGTHYGSILGSCEFTPYVDGAGMSESDLKLELRRGKIAGTDQKPSGNNIQEAQDTTNKYYYYGRTDAKGISVYTVTAKTTTAPTGDTVAGVQMNRSFYRNDTGGASNGCGARLTTTLFMYAADTSMNKNGKTDLWVWVGSRTAGRPVLAGIGEGEYVTWKEAATPSFTASVFDSDTTNYTMTVSLRDGVPTGGTWSATENTAYIQTVNGKLNSNGTYTLNLTVNHATLGKAGEAHKRDVLEYSVDGKIYYGVIEIVPKGNVRLVIEGGYDQGYGAVFGSKTLNFIARNAGPNDNPYKSSETLNGSLVFSGAQVQFDGKVIDDSAWATYGDDKKTTIKIGGNWPSGYNVASLVVTYTFTCSNGNGYTVTKTEKLPIYKDQATADDAKKAMGTSLTDGAPVTTVPKVDAQPVDALPVELEDWRALIRRPATRRPSGRRISLARRGTRCPE